MKKQTKITLLAMCITLVVTGVLAMSGTEPACAATSTGTVCTASTLVRSSTGSTYTTRARYYYGKKFTITGEVTSSSGTRFYTTTYNSKKSYVRAGAVDRLEGDTMYYGETRQTKITETLNVRKGPGTTYATLGSISKGTVTTVYGYKTVKTKKWYKIKYSGKYGYVIGDYVTLQKKATGIISANKLNVRKGTSTSTTLLGTFKKGNTFTILGSVKNSSTGRLYYKLNYKGKTGYVYSKYVTKRIENNYTYGVARYGKTKATVNYRTDAGTSYTSKGKIPVDSIVALYGYKRTTEGVKWYRVKYNGTSGYVHGDYMTGYSSSSISVKVATTTDGINVRSGAGTSYSVIGYLGKGSMTAVDGSKKDSSGKLWYKIDYDGRTGYICAQYTTVKTNTISAKDAMDFEVKLNSEGFPESYKTRLRALFVIHPNWRFKAQQTGATWAEALEKENYVGRSLVHYTQPAAWKSFDRGAYDFSSGRYVIYDGAWNMASKQLIAYYLDPRNFLTDTGIFQFVGHKYNSKSQSTATIKNVSNGSFLMNSFPGGAYSHYYNAVYAAGKSVGMNPNVLASMILQEQGSKGTSSLISGTYPGYRGYYNFLNVGAYASGGRNAVENGLLYAKGGYSGSTSYYRPWNSRYKAIKGGADFYMSNYVREGQDTLYLKKWNVNNGVSTLGTHQYMTNVEGAADEAWFLYSAYKKSTLTTTFYIPVYKNMPSNPCKKPGTSGNNNNVLKSLTAKTSSRSYLSGFSRYTTSYDITVPKSVSSITIGAAAYSSGAKITGTGTRSLSVGKNKISVKVKSSSGLTRTYTINITRKSS